MASKKDNSKGAAKSVSKSAAKPAAKPAAKAPAKPVAKAPAKPAPKAPAKPVAKAPAKAAAAKPVPTKPVLKSNGKEAPKPAAKAAPAPAAKASAAKTPAIAPKSNGKTNGNGNGNANDKSNGKVAAPAPAPAKAGAKAPAPVKGAAPAPVKGAATAPVKGAAPAKPAPAKGAGKSKADPLDPPAVPKKGPIDLAQHKSVAAAAAAVANARGPASSGDFIIINGRRVRAISTKGLTIPKRAKDTATEAAAAPTEQQIASIKTKLSKKELDEYRTLLLAKRRQLVGMLSGMEDEALRSSGGNLSNMPVHMADMGSDVYEQDFTLGMAENERALLDEIDAALQRIEDKTYGVCQMTGKPISKARLDAKPWAKYTIEAERIAESSGGR
ncbi:MAG: ral stress protein [Planctomycetota bacterium]